MLGERVRRQRSGERPDHHRRREPDHHERRHQDPGRHRAAGRRPARLPQDRPGARRRGPGLPLRGELLGVRRRPADAPGLPGRRHRHRLRGQHPADLRPGRRPGHPAVAGWATAERPRTGLVTAPGVDRHQGVEGPRRARGSPTSRAPPGRPRCSRRSTRSACSSRDITPVERADTQVAAALQGGVADLGISIEPLTSVYLAANPTARPVAKAERDHRPLVFFIATKDALDDKGQLGRPGRLHRRGWCGPSATCVSTPTRWPRRVYVESVQAQPSSGPPSWSRRERRDQLRTRSPATSLIEAAAAAWPTSSSMPARSPRRST